MQNTHHFKMFKHIIEYKQIMDNELIVLDNFIWAVVQMLILVTSATIQYCIHI